MDIETLNKLGLWRCKLQGEIDEAKAQLKEDIKDKEAKLKKIEEKLMPVINQTGGKGTTKNHKLPNGYIMYASESDKYRCEDRDSLHEWIMKEPESRLGIFTNAVTKDEVEYWRRETGATDLDGKLDGGKLPAGVGLHVVKKVNFRKG